MAINYLTIARLLSVILLFHHPVTTLWAKETITLATLEWPPYTGSTLEGKGYASILVKEVFKRSNIEVNIEFYQWSRTIGLAKSGKVDGYFPEYFSKEVQSFALLSDPFPGGALGFFKLRNRDIRFTSLQDLRHYTIGTVKGYTNTKELDQSDDLVKEPVKDDLTNLRKLIAGRIDLMVGDELVGNHLIQSYTPEMRDKIEFINTTLDDSMDLFVCFPINRPRSAFYLRQFNKGLQEMKKDGSLYELLNRYGF